MLLDGGGLFLHRGFLDALKAETIMEAYGLYDYDLINVSNLDFLFSRPFLLDQAASHGLNLLSANTVDAASGGHLFARTALLTRNGVTIGVTGVVGSKYQFTLDEWLAPDQQVRLTDETTALAECVAMLRPQADLVVVLASTGVDAAKNLARQVDGIDLIICAHNAELIDDPLCVNGTWLVKAGSLGQFIGHVTLRLDTAGQIAAITHEAVILDREVPESPAMLPVIDRYHLRLADYQDLLIKRDQLPPAEGGAYIGAAACARCHLHESGRWRLTGHADAWRALTERNQHYNPECIGCHITGYGYLGGFDLPGTTPEMVNIQCEMCHGPGLLHQQQPGTGYGAVDQNRCLPCHTEEHSPAFAYDQYYPRIAH